MALEAGTWYRTATLSGTCLIFSRTGLGVLSILCRDVGSGEATVLYRIGSSTLQLASFVYSGRRRAIRLACAYPLGSISISLSLLSVRATEHSQEKELREFGFLRVANATVMLSRVAWQMGRPRLAACRHSSKSLSLCLGNGLMSIHTIRFRQHTKFLPRFILAPIFFLSGPL